MKSTSTSSGRTRRFYSGRFPKHFITIACIGLISTALLIYDASSGYNVNKSLLKVQVPNFGHKQVDVDKTGTMTWTDDVNVTDDQAALLQHPKWIVLTTSKSYPNLKIKQLELSLTLTPGWTLLVVEVADSDSKTRPDWSTPHPHPSPNIIYLSTAVQSKLDYSVLKYLPDNASSSTRKMIGYLYAIQHGAKYIFDTTDDSDTDNEAFDKNFEFNETTRGLVLLPLALLQHNNENTTTTTPAPVVNPYVHFGQPTVWPRGFPLDQVGQPYENTYTACTLPSPVVQQGLVNGNPDIDADAKFKFRQTRKSPPNLDLKFDEHAPPLILPPSVMAPFNARNTLFHYKAFWGLVLPTSVSARVADIWRGYWAQPLLWKIGGTLGFYPPRSSSTQQQKSAKSAQNLNFGEEDKLYKEAGSLVKFLAKWTCPSSNLLLYECMADLAKVMAERGFWSLVEIQLVTAWISDLKLVGYREPAFVQVQGQESSPCLKDKNQNFAMFSPATQQGGQKIDPEMKARIPLRKFCNFPLPSNSNPANLTTTPAPVPTKSKVDPEFPKTLLVVEFNHPHYENLWLLDLIYRPHFPNLLYCGTLKATAPGSDRKMLLDLLARKEFVGANAQKFSFVNANVLKGWCSYECGLRALDFKFMGIEGYLVVSDDVLLNFWNIAELDKTQPWFGTGSTSQIAIKNIDDVYKPYGWNEGNPVRLPGTIPAKKLTLERTYLVNEKNIYWLQFRQNRDRWGYTNTSALWAYSDLFYFPESKQEMFYTVGSVVREFGLQLETGVPFLMTGLTAGPQKLVNLTGHYIWGGQRSKPFELFNPSQNFIHPVKPSEVISRSALRREFCEKYVARVLAFGAGGPTN